MNSKLEKSKLNKSALSAFKAVVIVGLVALLAGCSLDKWIEVPAGEYTVDRQVGEASRSVGKILATLEIDRDESIAVFEFADGTQLETPFSARDRSAWPAGCPGNLYSVHMEVLDLEGEAIQIGALSYPDPVLVRDCPPEPLQVLLRSDGPVGGAGSGCSNVDECVYFKLR
jgi:hypothetical protein